MCYGLSVCAHAALAWACAVTPVRVMPSDPGGAAVVMQVSSGTRVSMPLLKPRPGASEQGNPEAEVDDNLPNASRPDAIEQAPPDQGASDLSPPTEGKPTSQPDAPPPPVLADADPPPILEAAPPPGTQPQAMQDTPGSTTQPVPADMLEEALAWTPASPRWEQPTRPAPTPDERVDARTTATTGDGVAEQPQAQDSDVPTQTPDAPATQVAEAMPTDHPPPPAVDPPEPTPQPTDPTDTEAAASAETDDDAGRVFDESQVDTPIRFAKQVRPTASAISRRHNETGTVVVLIRVEPDGELAQVDVLDDAGHPRLAEAALRALYRSSFTPATRAGEPVSSTRRIEYRF